MNNIVTQEEYLLILQDGVTNNYGMAKIALRNELTVDGLNKNDAEDIIDELFYLHPNHQLLNAIKFEIINSMKDTVTLKQIPTEFIMVEDPNDILVFMHQVESLLLLNNNVKEGCLYLEAVLEASELLLKSISTKIKDLKVDEDFPYTLSSELNYATATGINCESVSETVDKFIISMQPRLNKEAAFLNWTTKNKTPEK